MPTDKKDVKQAPNGKEDRSILHDEDRKGKNSPSRSQHEHQQFDNQPEFIENHPNQKDKEEEI